MRRAEAMSLVSTTLVGIAVAERVRHLGTGPTDTVALVRSPRGGVGFPSDRPPLRPGKIRVSILQDHHRAIPAWFAACRRNRRAPSPSDREPGPDGVARATLACGVESLSQQIRTCNLQSTRQIKGTSDERENCFLDR